MEKINIEMWLLQTKSCKHEWVKGKYSEKVPTVSDVCKHCNTLRALYKQS